MAHAPAAIPGPGNGCVCAAVDAAARAQGLLGHGEAVRGISEVPCHVQHGAVAVDAIGEYASGKFNEPWFDLAFQPVENLTKEGKREILERAFQLNHERLMWRWPRFVELHEWASVAGGAQALVTFTARDWRDLQVLSQLAWMDEEWLAKDEVICRLANREKISAKKTRTS